jgi:subfamily B ATP-binding cassette protein HlyB/CyaB
LRPFGEHTARASIVDEAAHHDHAFEQGVTALTILSRLHGRGVAPEQVRQHCKGDRALGMKLRAHNCDWKGLSHLSLPAIAVLRAGGFLLLGQIVEDRVVAADLTSRRPRYMSQTELERLWDGRVVALAPRRTLKDSPLGRERLRNLLD